MGDQQRNIPDVNIGKARRPDIFRADAGQNGDAQDGQPAGGAVGRRLEHLLLAGAMHRGQLHAQPDDVLHGPADRGRNIMQF